MEMPTRRGMAGVVGGWTVWMPEAGRPVADAAQATPTNEAEAELAVRAVALLLLAGCHSWTRADTAAQVAIGATFAIDMMQTQRAIETPGYIEGNPIIGKHGENVSPYAYFPMAFAIHLIVAALLRPRPRAAWLGFVGAWQTAIVTKNQRTLNR